MNTPAIALEPGAAETVAAARPAEIAGPTGTTGRKIHYFVGQNMHSFGGGSGEASAISSWVAAHFTARTVGGETVYDLTAPAG